MLLEYVTGEFKSGSDDLLTLEVRESNIAALKLYKRAGFKITGRRKHYYNKPDEDAIIMSK